MTFPELEARAAGGFDAHAGHYDASARIQRWAAERLAELLRIWADEVPPGPVVELAAGTGLVTSHLLRLFPGRSLAVSDASPAMVAELEAKFGERRGETLSIRLQDATHSQPDLNRCSAAVCAFSLQWFSHADQVIRGWLEAMPEGSICFVSWPGAGSFPQWKRMAELAGVAFTGNPLPSGRLVDEVLAGGDAELLYHAREWVDLAFATPMDFFRSIRDVGAGSETQERGQRRNLLALVRQWERLHPDQVTVSHCVHFAAFRRR